jgi:hypothetical protein
VRSRLVPWLVAGGAGVLLVAGIAAARPESRSDAPGAPAPVVSAGAYGPDVSVLTALEGCSTENLDNAEAPPDLVAGSVGEPMTVQKYGYDGAVVYTIRSMRRAGFQEPAIYAGEDTWLVVDVEARVLGHCPVTPGPEDFRVVAKDGTAYPAIGMDVAGQLQSSYSLTDGETIEGSVFIAAPECAFVGGVLTVSDEQLEPYGYWPIGERPGRCASR